MPMKADGKVRWNVWKNICGNTMPVEDEDQRRDGRSPVRKVVEWMRACNISEYPDHHIRGKHIKSDNAPCDQKGYRKKSDEITLTHVRYWARYFREVII